MLKQLPKFTKYDLWLIGGLIIFIGSLALLVDLYFNPWFVPEEKTKNDLSQLKKITLDLGGKVKVLAYLLSTSEEKRLGLANQEDLGEKEGALFLYFKPVKPRFWMKGMLFAIDIIWISEDKTIVDITENIAPETFPKTFAPKEPVKYVLEVKAGFAQKYNLKVGDKVKFLSE